VRLKLDDKLIRALAPGDYYDTVRRRLVLRVRPDSRRYVIRYRITGAEPRRFTVGNAIVMTLAEARVRAKNLLADVDKGQDPHEERRQLREAIQTRGFREGAGLLIEMADQLLTRAPAAIFFNESRKPARLAIRV
jgi:hypothetical protein